MSSNRFVVARLLAGILAANCLQMAISSTVRADIVRGIPGTNAFSSASLPSYRYDDYDLEKYQSALNDVQRNYEQAQRVMDGANRDLQGAQSREDEINRSLNDQGRALEANTRKQADLSQAIVQKNNQLQSVQRDIPGLQNDVANLEREISSTQTVVQDLQNRLNAAAAADKPAIQAQLNTQTQILMQFKVTLSVKSKMLADANANLARLQAELSQTGPQMNALKGEENQLRGRIAEMQRNLEEARRRTQDATRNRDNAGRALQEQGRAVEFARRNVDQVNSNINAAANVLGAQGNDQGINDGSREGIELGNQRGGNDGRDAGIREGTAAGTDAGQKRDYNTGYEAGKAKAISDATADSEAKAQKDGNENGRNDGIADGKNEAYRVGKNEGLDHGAKTGDDTVAYQAGRKQGEADGLAKAVSDAQAQVAVGYQEKENEFLNATLAPVTVGDSSLADKFKGLQGRYSNEGDDRYYNPQPGMLPHPRLQRFYMDAYDSAYRSTLSQSYASAYSASRNAQYTAYYNSTYNDNLNKSYPDWQQSGNGQGRADFYQRTFDANYATRYRQIHDDVHDKYFDQYKTDKGEHDRGFKDGNQIASRDKGYSEGKSAAYAANIEIEKKKAHDVGVKKANDLYTNNAVIKISSIEMKDVDGDGVLRPGENVVMMIKLKNYGLQAKTDLQSELSGVDGALSVASAKITTGTIPAKSDATVIVPVQAAISPTAVDGDTLSLTVSAKSGDKTYFTQKMAATAQYPVGAQIVGFDGILIPGVETPVTLKVTNRSKSIQNLNVTATVDTSKVGIDQNVLSAQGLNPGQSMDLKVKLTGKIEARFEESALQFTVAQNGLKFAMDAGLKMTLIQRHVSTAASKGLILSQNLAAGGGKKFYTEGTFDTWDLRVDGALKDASKLDDYKNKVVYIMADAYSAMDADTAKVLAQFVAQNGSVVLWGGRMDYSDLAKALLPSVGTKVSTAQTLNGNATGSGKLQGLNLSVRGVVSVLAGSDSKSSNVMNSSVGNIIVIKSGKGVASTVGQSMIVGVDVADLEDAQIQQILKAYDNVRASFDTKMAMAMKDPATYMNLVAQEIVDEMYDAEATYNGSFYKNNSDSNKIYKAASKFIGEAGKKSAQAQELSKYYPLFESVLNGKIKNESFRAQLVLEKRFGSFFTARSLKDVYCENNVTNDLCRDGRGPGGG